MKSAPRRKKLFIVIGIYLALWLLTALVGIGQVDSAFDREIAMGSFEFADSDSPDVPVQRVDFFDVADLDAFPSDIPDAPWRCRSTGVAVAPFVIIDEVAWQQYPLGGFGGRRMVFWAFGYVRWVPIARYWVS